MADQRRAGLDFDFVQAHIVVSAANRPIEKVQRVGGQQELHHARATQDVRREHVVRTGAADLLLRLFRIGPGDDTQLGVELPGGQHQVNVLRVIGQGRDEPHGPLDPRGM